MGDRELRNSTQFTRRRFLASLGATTGLMAIGDTGFADAPTVPCLDSLVGPQGIDWQQVRQSFLLAEGLTYLNNGSLGPSPTHVVEEAFKAWRILEQNPVEEGFGPLLEKAEAVRARAAAFLGCTADEIAITQSTTDGMNMVAQGIDWREGDRVLTSNQEHAGGLASWQYYAKRKRIAIDTVELPLLPRDADEIVKLFAAKITKQTRVISVSHVTYTTGLRLPIADIAMLAKEHGCLFVVDGAQAPGGLVVDVKKLGCHAYATSAHKWLLAPKGTGLLYVSTDAKEQIAPLALDAGYRVYTGNTGTRNIPGIIGLGAAIDFLDKLGKQNVSNRTLQLASRVHVSLSKLLKIKVVSPPPGPFSSALVTCELPKGTSAETLAGTLKTEHKTIVRAISAHSVNGIRISTHVYNSERDIDTVVFALRKELA